MKIFDARAFGQGKRYIDMKLLEDRIAADGRIYPGDILKVDSFVNHQIDVPLMDRLGQEFCERFRSAGVTKILTIEASGIGIACLTARYFGVPVVFAKKSRTKNLGQDVWTAEVPSYTHGNVNTVLVSKSYLSETDTVLIIDDFLATGAAVVGLNSLCSQAGAKVAGVGILVEKSYQAGRGILEQLGLRVESLARISRMSDDGSIEFIPD